ncbi:nuclease-related domain-containing protein [Sporosarcina aquimarina]|uniref:Nuclease-related domain-containing protein n=1 Tax=Sporosarcina aquimarina TaxID=114975 RepID=A0ABU4FV52_9BACL|nr:nuclease-related domain-containing protein [Sporosarcina aquimarina]MDW0108589.1 nuclease-related domain-containing protein [Sporosarcina aquimarina]
MLYKQRTKPKQLEGLQSLARRLTPAHEKYRFIQEELYKILAGHGGELEYDRCMKEVHTDFPHAILHDLSLSQNGVQFQIDSLFIAPDRIIITEVKNIADKIIIKANPTQFLKESQTGSRNVFRNPIAEVERKIHFLNSWLRAKDIHLPVTGLITFAHNNEILIEEPPTIPILTNYEAPAFFRELPIESTILAKSDIQKLAHVLLTDHQDYNPFPLAARYGIHPNELKNGVLCDNCPNEQAIVREKDLWNCPICGNKSREPYEQAIKEYFMLIGKQLTNREFCRFTGLTCRHTAKRLLSSPLLRKEGTRKSTKYTLTT